MKKDIKAVAKITSATLSNISVVGFGLAVFEQRWWCLAVAIGAYVAACIIEWRTEND